MREGDKVGLLAVKIDLLRTRSTLTERPLAVGILRRRNAEERHAGAGVPSPDGRGESSGRGRRWRPSPVYSGRRVGEILFWLGVCGRVGLDGSVVEVLRARGVGGGGAGGLEGSELAEEGECGESASGGRVGALEEGLGDPGV